MLAPGVGNSTSLARSTSAIHPSFRQPHYRSNFLLRDRMGLQHATQPDVPPFPSPRELRLHHKPTLHRHRKFERNPQILIFWARWVRDHLQYDGSSPISSSRPIKGQRKQIKPMTQSVALPLPDPSHPLQAASVRRSNVIQSYSSSRERDAANTVMQRKGARSYQKPGTIKTASRHEPCTRTKSSLGLGRKEWKLKSLKSRAEQSVR